MYKEVILEHYKQPRNHGKMADATLSSEGINPSCGDEVELFLKLEEGVVKEVSFVGEGCAISQSSTSMLTEAIEGKTVAEALELAAQFKAMIQGEDPAETLGDLKVLRGVSKLHARVKCATLAWVTLEEALEGVKQGGAETRGA